MGKLADHEAPPFESDPDPYSAFGNSVDQAEAYVQDFFGLVLPNEFW